MIGGNFETKNAFVTGTVPMQTTDQMLVTTPVQRVICDDKQAVSSSGVKLTVEIQKRAPKSNAGTQEYHVTMKRNSFG